MYTTVIFPFEFYASHTNAELKAVEVELRKLEGKECGAVPLKAD